MRVRVKNINIVRAGGRVYFYHRVTRERLPPAPAARAARALTINAELDKQQPERPITAMPGTVADVIQRYRASADFRSKAPATKVGYLQHLDFLAQTIGDLQIADIDRPTVLTLRDSFTDTPTKANYLVQIIRLIMTFAIDRGFRVDNPASPIKRLETGEGYQPWPDIALDRFLAEAAPRMAWAVALGLFTGQRQADVLRMRWQHIEGGSIVVAQQKTGERLSVPIHRDLARILDQIPRDHMMILTTSAGRAWTPSGFRASFRKQLDRLGLSGLTYHGLRHTAGKKLAEAGCADREIMAILGHKSVQVVTRYTKKADQKRLGRAAILRWESGTNDE